MAVQLRLLSRDSALGAGRVRTMREYRLKHHFAVSSDARGVERLFPPDLPQSRRVIRTRAYRGGVGLSICAQFNTDPVWRQCLAFPVNYWP